MLTSLRHCHWAIVAAAAFGLLLRHFAWAPAAVCCCHFSLLSFICRCWPPHAIIAVVFAADAITTPPFADFIYRWAADYRFSRFDGLLALWAWPTLAADVSFHDVSSLSHYFAIFHYYMPIAAIDY